jgi:hypothetical protein
MKRITMMVTMLAVFGAMPVEATGVLRIYGGAGTGDFYRGGGGASFGFDIPISEERAFYLGGQFTFHNGSENRILPAGVVAGLADEIGDASQSQIGLEIGATIASHPWIFRPAVGGGMSRISLDSGTIVLTFERRGMVYGGATLGRMIAETAMIGIEVRAMRVGDLGNSVAGYLTLGTTFGN